jgi:ferrochelatase
MRIDNLTYLVGGELKSRPAVTSVASITSNPSQVRRGDLYIAYNKDGISLALERGAYGIIFEGWAQVSDPEIAWIKVKSIREAIIKLMRYELIKKNPSIYLLDPITHDLAREIFCDCGVMIAQDSPMEDFESIIKGNFHTILFREDGYFEHLGLESKELPRLPIELSFSTLFESSFVFDGHYHFRTPIPPLLIPHLQTILSLAKKSRLCYSLQQRPTSHFYPMFVDENFRIVDFGSSERAVIHEPSISFAKEAKKHILLHAPWADVVFASSKAVDGFIHAPDIDAIKEIMYNCRFRYILFAGSLPSLHTLQKKRQEVSLL